MCSTVINSQKIRKFTCGCTGRHPAYIQTKGNIMRTTSDEILSLLLGCDETEDGVSDVISDVIIDEKTGFIVPSLDERVDMWLRGVYGFDREFTDEQRAETRIRIFFAMAIKFFGEKADELNATMKAFLKSEAAIRDEQN